MKLFYGAGISLLAIYASVRAEPLQLPARGPHHKVVSTGSGAYVAVANGMHYLEAGEWKESDPTIDLHPNGASALRLPQKILFGQSLAAGVDILTPDSLHLRGAPRAIAYFDALDGRTVILSTLKDPPTAAAQLHPPNVLVYPDAFDGVRASIRYVVEKGSIIQCVVFPENLPDPALFGMSPAVRIEVWNAFTEAPTPQQTDTVVWANPDPLARALMAEPDLIDTTLDFSQMRMIPGKSFLLSEAKGHLAPGADIPGSVPVFKQWLPTPQESWLIEAVEHAAVRDKLARLPASSLVIDPNTASQFVSEGRDLPMIDAPQPVNLPIPIVDAPPTEDGFCIDYTLVYSASSWTFQSGVTYLVDGSFTISSSTVIQTNAIIKYRRNAVLTLSGSLTTPATGPPAILTSFDDYTAGELLPGGTPVGYIGTTALSLYNITGYYVYVENLEFRQFKTAISYYSPSATHIIRNCRFHVCQTGLNAYYTTVTLSNSVACAVPTLYTNAGSSSIATSTISTDCQRFVDTGGSNDYGQRNVPSSLTNNVIAVAGGSGHSLALKADGTVVGWGANNYGQTNIPADLTNVIGIACGSGHSLALKADGTVVAWGYNNFGQTNVPAGLTNVIDIKGGYWHSSALKVDGTVTNWGYGGFFLSPIPSDVTNVVAIGAPNVSGIALRSNGTIRVWGGATDAINNPPLTNAVAASLGIYDGMALRADGSLVGWGVNLFGQTNVPASVTNTIAVASAVDTVAALKRDGTVRTWGYGQYGETNLPFGLSNVVALSAGDRHFVFIRAGAATPTITTTPQSTRRFVGGTITLSVGVYSPIPVTYQWQFNGTNIAGATNASLTLTSLQVTNAGSYTVIVSNSAGSITSAAAVLTVISEPIILSQPSDLRVLAGSNVTFSLVLSNAVGATNFWQFNGSTVFISSATNYTFTASTATHGIWTVISSNQVGATLSDPWTLQVVLPGGAVGWGDTAYGQINAPYLTTNLVAVAAGEHHSLGLKDDGTVIGWGMVMHGETNPPAGLSDVIAIGAGSAHSLALKGDGTVIAWGYNAFGQTNVPSGLSTVKSIAAGYWHSLALKTNGTVVAWGYNGSDQTNVPAGLSNAIAISAGWSHSLALRADGTVCGWGMNNDGQCDAPSSLSNVVAISAGIWHSLALKADGTVVGWGANTYGEINSPAGLSNVLAIAGGGQYSLALKNDGTVVAWGKAIFGVTNVPPLFDVYAIAAGFNHALALTYSPVLNYVIDPSRDLLLVCNTNCADSVAVMNYYRTNRPMVSSANVLGIGGVTNAVERYTNRVEMTNTLITPVLTWLTNNPTKRPNYIILFYGVPAGTRVLGGDGHPDNHVTASVTLNLRYTQRRPFVMHINMRTPQDCFAYIDKLANFGTNYSPDRIYISASAGGYAGTNYFFDNIRENSLNNSPTTGGCASSALVSYGAVASQIFHIFSTNYYDHFFHCTNVAGYISWGYHGGQETGFPTNGNFRFYNSSAWYIIQTLESWNGQWVPQDSQTSFHDYFTTTAFWGNNYANTPVGTVTHVDEPGMAQGCPESYGGVASPHYLFGFWYNRKSFAVCAWSARGTAKFQAVGDPFITR